MNEERRNECREYKEMIIRLEERMDGHDKFHSNEAKSLDLARAEVNRRLLEMNEMRQQINIERGSYIIRTEYEAKHGALVEAIAGLQKFMWTVTGILIGVQFLLAMLMRFWTR